MLYSFCTHTKAAAVVMVMAVAMTMAMAVVVAMAVAMALAAAVALAMRKPPLRDGTKSPPRAIALWAGLRESGHALAFAHRILGRRIPTEGNHSI